MKAVKISEFKAHLAKYLRLVKDGEEINILDRGTLVAKVITPHPLTPKLEIRSPLKDPKNLATLTSKLNKAFKGEIMDLLQEERNRR